MSGCACNRPDPEVDITGKVPDTYKFACPGGPNCSCCKKPPKKDMNCNKCEEKKKEEPKKCEEAAPPPPPPPRCMPKTECKQCQQKEKTVEKCEPPKYLEDNPPPICTQLPETKTFKCAEDDCECQANNNSPKTLKLSQTCASPNPCDSCGAPVPRAVPCDCGKPLPPAPKMTCGCKNALGGPCLPNTSCEVFPLTMKRRK